jgi:hypothetical protein
MLENMLAIIFANFCRGVFSFLEIEIEIDEK